MSAKAIYPVIGGFCCDSSYQRPERVAPWNVSLEATVERSDAGEIPKIISEFVRDEEVSDIAKRVRSLDSMAVFE